MWFIRQQTLFGNVAQESMPSPALLGTSGMFQKENMKIGNHENRIGYA
jgi:hypothetical protein